MPTSELLKSAQRIMQRCDTLANLSSMNGAICRTYLTAEHKACNQQVEKWMIEAGLRTWVDAAGNCWGSYLGESETTQTIILGSHLDTVPNAGRYDGILGVLTAIEFIDFLNQNDTRLPFNIDVVGFGDEEGVRFGATLLGSRAVAGTWLESWGELRDQDQISMTEALTAFHNEYVDPLSASRAEDDIVAYLELHIEQGPVLEQQNLPVGVVSSIAGARRFQFKVFGMAGHAGTVPMALRSDALTISSHIVLQISEIAKRHHVVATVGKIQAFPGSINVIPGACEFSLDIRSGLDDSRDMALEDIFQYIEALKKEMHFTLEFEEVHSAKAVKCASWIQRSIEDAIKASDLTPISMVSGAGHDAMAFDGVCDIGMIFVRCDRGISHHPAESVTAEDVACGLDILHKSVVGISTVASEANKTTVLS